MVFGSMIRRKLLSYLWEAIGWTDVEAGIDDLLQRSPTAGEQMGFVGKIW